MTSPAATLLKDLIRRPSVTPVEAGALDVLEAFLAPLGFTITRLTFEGDGSYPVDNLHATRQGRAGGPHLLFCGHTDVVPPGDLGAWTHEPFSGLERNGEIWGRGATDMKSGIAAFCAAIARVSDSGLLDHGTVTLAITNDEEADAINGIDKLMAWAATRCERYDFAIVGEPSSFETLGDSIKIGRRGALSGRITVLGKQGHAAYPERARNPAPVLAALATALDRPFDEGTEYFQPTNLEVTSIDIGNPTANVIPAKGELRFNVRFNDRWDGDTMKAEITRRIESIDARGCAVSWEVIGAISRNFVCAPAGHAQLLCEVIEKVTGRRPALATNGGTSDARFIASYCPVVECGLVGRTMHQVDERVPMADLEGLVDIYAAFLTAFMSEGHR